MHFRPITFIGTLIPKIRSTLVSRSVSPSQVVCTRPQARALAHGLDRAIENGQWELADRIARSSVKLANHHPMLAERLARLHLLQGRPEEALSIIDACAAKHVSLRMLHAVALLKAGHQAEAHLDLQNWAQQAEIPAQARSLLAFLDWRTGDVDAARRVLQQNIREKSDSESLAALMLISAAEGNHTQSQHWAQQLAHVLADDPAMHQFELMMQMLDISVSIPAQTCCPRKVETLALELVAGEAAIPALVEAAAIDSSTMQVPLLSASIERALPELEEPAAAYIALVRLHLLMNNDLEAHRWATEGVAACPMSVALRHLHQDLIADSTDKASESLGVAA